MFYETKFLISLILTEVIEVPVVYVLVKFVFGKFPPKKISSLRILGFAFLASLLTLPYLWFVMRPYFDQRYYVYIGEIIVFLAEGFLYWFGLKVRWYEAFSVSLIANFISWYFGLDLFNWILLAVS